MSWPVLEHPAFVLERAELPGRVSDKLDATLLLLEQVGPRLGRPAADRLNGSAHVNMKELRFSLNGVWRFAFAFDTDRNAVILVGDDKQSKDSKRFYKTLIAVADVRFDEWLDSTNE